MIMNFSVEQNRGNNTYVIFFFIRNQSYLYPRFKISIAQPIDIAVLTEI
uniref:Uncharacterized protein n=1 Tax=Arundo donax TaxID=35708 RepID=A0A0A9CK10_ARUDO